MPISSASVATAGLLLLGGCGLATGYFQGPRTGPGGGFGSGEYVAQTVTPQGGETTNYRGGLVVTDRMGFGLGTMLGYSRIKASNNGVSAEEAGRDLHVYADAVYHFSPSFTLSADTGIDLQNFDHLDEDLQLGDSSYLGIDFLFRVVFAASESLQLYGGGGYVVGGISGLSTDAWKATAGFQASIGELWLPVLLRVEAGAATGDNDFQQLTVNGGFVFWFRPG